MLLRGSGMGSPPTPVTDRVSSLRAVVKSPAHGPDGLFGTRDVFPLEAGPVDSSSYLPLAGTAVELGRLR
jgi:hypothetical protein